MVIRHKRQLPVEQIIQKAEQELLFLSRDYKSDKTGGKEAPCPLSNTKYSFQHQHMPSPNTATLLQNEDSTEEPL